MRIALSVGVLLCHLATTIALRLRYSQHRIYPTIRTISGITGNPPPRGPRGDSRLFMNNIPENDTTKEIDENRDEKDGDNVISRQWKKLSEESRDDIKTSVVSFAFAVFVRVFLYEPRYIPSLSMFPTFDVGDQLLVDKITHVVKNYQKRDVVVFNPSDTYIALTGNTEALIKRVVAVAGDTVEVKNNHLYVNGEEQVEPYTNELPEYDLAPIRVPAGMLLVLGDNRNHSFDSHVWGYLPEKNVIGRAVLKYWPPWRAGIVEGSL